MKTYYFYESLGNGRDRDRRRGYFPLVNEILWKKPTFMHVKRWVWAYDMVYLFHNNVATIDNTNPTWSTESLKHFEWGEKKYKRQKKIAEALPCINTIILIEIIASRGFWRQKWRLSCHVSFVSVSHVIDHLSAATVCYDL